MRQRILFGELLSDQADYGNGGLTVADNCFWTPAGYRPLPAPAAIANGDLGATPLGGTAYRVNGVVHALAGTAAKLRRYTAAGWADLATGLTASADVGWRFQEVSGYMLATNGTDAIKRYDPSAGTVADLGGTPPTARFITVVRDRVVLGYTASTERKINWSDAGDMTDWTAAVGGPGSYEFPSGGAITALGGGEFGIVAQETSLTRLTPAYDGSTWQYDVISDEIGCIAPWSWTRYGRLHFFLSAKGWMMTDGASVTPIGEEKIDRSFAALADRSYYGQMSAEVDPKNGVLFVAIPNASAPTRLLMYHIGGQKWTTGTVSGGVVRLFSGLSQSVTLEQLDATNPSLDAMTTSLDDRIFQGGYPELMLFNSSNALQGFTGTPLEATFTPGEMELVPGRRARLRRVRPIVDASSGLTITVAGRNGYGDTQAETDYSTMTSAGEFAVRENWNNHQVTLTIAAGTTWSRAQGFDLVFEEGGRA